MELNGRRVTLRAITIHLVQASPQQQRRDDLSYNAVRLSSSFEVLGDRRALAASTSRIAFRKARSSIRQADRE